MDTSRLLDSVKHVHFVGIGGSGMCPLAEPPNVETGNQVLIMRLFEKHW